MNQLTHFVIIVEDGVAVSPLIFEPAFWMIITLNWRKIGISRSFSYN
jgi:hypothetical protein